MGFTVCRVLCILALGSLIVAPVGFFVSMFIYDSPLSGGFITGAIAWSIWTFPVTASLGGIKGLNSCKAHNLTRAVVWTMVAWISQLVFGVSLALLQLLCNGKFQCF